jgi:hypothetical protein
MKKYIVSVLASAAVAVSASASQIAWEVALSDGRYSTGEPIPTGYTFALGTFTGGFVPTFENADQWFANWSADGLVPNLASWTNLEQPAPFDGFGTAQGSTVIGSNALQGQQGYMWGYDSLDTSTVPQWILITNAGWVFPGVTSPPVVSEWATTQQGSNAIVGFINHPSFAGDDDFLSRITTTQAIPEPSTYALIFGLGILGFLGYRRFRK